MIPNEDLQQTPKGIPQWFVHRVDLNDLSNLLVSISLRKPHVVSCWLGQMGEPKITENIKF